MKRPARPHGRPESAANRPSAAEINQDLATALQYHQSARFEEAKTLYHRVLQARPEHPGALHYLGLMSHQFGQHDRAVSLISRAIAADGKVGLYYYNLGEAYRALDRLDEAVASFRQALSLEDDIADAHYALGNVLYDQGKLNQAIERYQRSIVLAPGDAEAHNNLGNALLDTGDVEGALASYRQALVADPQYGQAHVNLGNVIQDQGRLEDAVDHFRRAIALNPNLVEAHVNLGNAQRGNPDEAMACYQRALAIQPGVADALLGIGDVHKIRGETALAAESYMRALDAGPDNPDAFNKLGNALLELRSYEDAIATYRRALELRPDYADAICNLAMALIQVGQDSDAAPYLEKAIQLRPDLAKPYYGMGICLQQQGDFEAAAEWHRAALARRPDYGEALLSLALNKKAELSQEEIARLEALLEGAQIPVEERISLSFAMAKIWDDAGEYEKAFGYYRAANELKNRDTNIDPRIQIQRVDAVIETFSRDYFEHRRECGSQSQLPVFILGMPRSGTTLVEQIIASHPRVFGAGELSAMHELASALPELLNRSEDYPACATFINEGNADRLAEHYLTTLRGYSADADRITDKLPLNFLRLGLIAVLLPRARIIHCRRDPRDTCLSCYFQNFARGILFSYDLVNLGQFCRQYERLMEHWRAVLPVQMLEVEYEELITRPDDKTREIVDFCGLEWDPRCLAFHEHKRSIRTASFWQARQPMYASSVGRWRHYEPFLGPLMDALQGHDQQ